MDMITRRSCWIDVLPSLRDFEFMVGDDPSHKWLGYFQKPTRGMIADAASAGFYECATGKKYPRVQLLTIEGLLNHTQSAEHPDHAPDLNFKKAKSGGCGR